MQLWFIKSSFNQQKIKSIHERWSTSTPQKNWPKTSLLHRCCCCTWRDSNCKHVCCCCWQDLECSSSLTVGIAAAQWKVQWSAAIPNGGRPSAAGFLRFSKWEKPRFGENSLLQPSCMWSELSLHIFFVKKNSAADMICLSVKSATAAHGGHWSEF